MVVGILWGVESQVKNSFTRYYVNGSDLQSKVMLPTTTHMLWEWVWDGGKVENLFLLGITPLWKGPV